MNTFFGIAAPQDCSGPAEAMEKRIGELYGGTVRHLAGRANRVRCGFLEDSGAILGVAESDDCFLIYSGILQKPLPDWQGASPIDDTCATARYLLSRYQRHGAAFLDGVGGQYAVAVGDHARAKLVLGCDPSGGRRIFYRRDGERVVFATHLVSQAAAEEDGLPLDRSLEEFLLGYEFLPWRRTMFQGVTYLAKGAVLEFAGGHLTERKIAAGKASLPSPGPEETQVEEKAVEALHERFMEALRQQCPSAERVAVLLGGFDSALVAAALTRLGKKVETFSFSFPDASYNQAHTDTLSRHYGTKHTWVEITPEVIREGLSRFSLLFNQPGCQAHYMIETWHTVRTMRAAGYLHCFSGDGCDEVFLGYPTVHQRARLFMRTPVLPGPLVRLGRSLLSPRVVERRLGHVARLGRNTAAIMGMRMPVRGHIANRILDEVAFSRLRLDQPPPQSKRPDEILEELAEPLRGLSPLRLAYKGKSAVGGNRSKNEGSSCATGVTIQSPYQHPLVAQFASGLAEHLLRPAGKHESAAIGKYVLVRMVEKKKLLPPEIIYQKKASPVTSPVDHWYMGPLKEFMAESMNNLPFPCDPGYVRDLLRPKLAEDLFRDHFTLGRYAMHAVSLLATYGSFTRYGARAA